MVQVAIAKRANDDRALVRTRNVNQGQAVVDAAQINELIAAFHLHLVCLILLAGVLLIGLLYLCGLAFGLMMPQSVFDAYNPNATYVPLIGSFGYYKTPRIYKRGWCSVLDHGVVTHASIDVEVYDCGVQDQWQAVLHYLAKSNDPPLDYCAVLDKSSNVTAVLCRRDSLVLPWCTVRLKQAVTSIINVNVNVTGPYMNYKLRAHISSMQINGTHAKLPKEVSCDYLEDDNGAIVEVFLEVYESERNNHAYAVGFIIGFLLMAFVRWCIKQ